MKERYCLGFAFSEEENLVLLIRKSHPPWQFGKLNGLGGMVEEDEHPIEAMRREFMEEAGLEIRDWRHFGVIHTGNRDIHLFETVTNKLRDAHSMTKERLSLMAVFDILNSGGLGSVTLPSLRWLVPLALDRSKFAVITSDHVYDPL